MNISTHGVFLLLVTFFFALKNSFSQDVKFVPKNNVNDIVYDSMRDVIYISTSGSDESGNSICVVDPYFGNVKGCFFIGSEPNHMAISNNGEYLYVGLQGAAKVVQYNLELNEIVRSFGLGTDNFSELLFPGDIEVLPSHPESVVVSRINSCCSPNHEGVAIYDKGVMRPNTTRDHTGSNTIVFAQNRLFGYNNRSTGFGFREIEITETGLKEISLIKNLVSGFNVNIESDGNIIVADNGSIIDVTDSIPERMGVYTFENSNNAKVALSKNSDVVFFATSTSFSNGKVSIERFNKNKFTPISKYEIPNVTGRPTKLISWGKGKFLGLLVDDQLVIIRECNSIFDEPIKLNKTEFIGCQNQLITVTAPGGYENYYWSNGYTSQSFESNVRGTATVSTADSLGCLSPPSESIAFEFERVSSYIGIRATPSASFCSGKAVELKADGDDKIIEYQWSNGELGEVIKVDSPGVYSVSGITLNGCKIAGLNTQSINLLSDTLPSIPSIEIVGDSILCPGESVMLKAPAGYERYEWSNGWRSQTITITREMEVSVKVGNLFECMSYPSDTIKIISKPNPERPSISANENILMSSVEKGNQWFKDGQLLEGETDQFLSATSNGKYTVQISIDGCISLISMEYMHQILDLNPPVINCPTDLFVNCSLNIPAEIDKWIASVTASDMEDDSLIFETSYNRSTLQNLFCDQESSGHRIDFKVFDSSGNSATCFAHIRYFVDTFQRFVCPSDLILDCDINNTENVYEWFRTAFFNCRLDHVISFNFPFEILSRDNCNEEIEVLFKVNASCLEFSCTSRVKFIELEKPKGISLKLGVYLEGCYNSYSNQMNTDLNRLGYLPGQEPITFLGTKAENRNPYTRYPWLYSNCQKQDCSFDSVYASDIVDHILIELRSEIGPESKICETTGLLDKNGNIIFSNDNLCGGIDIHESYFVVIQHRNHLPIMSSTKVPILNGELSYDFRSQNSYDGIFGFGQKEITSNTFAMYAGNANQFSNMSQRNDINFGDLTVQLFDQGLNSSYFNSDVDLNGDVNTNDRVFILRNMGIFSSVPFER